MALSRDAYRELEDILGPDNLSEDPAALDAYSCFNFGATGIDPNDRFVTRPEAVVLPGSTQEVQAVIKMCNRRKIRSKAFSTGYGAHNGASDKNTIIIDLRRMNRVLEIDEKNMYAVVEPYVCFAQVQGEANKHGLNCHVIGAGSNCSYLASHTSMHGTSTQAISMGWSGRNVLGVEWVLPSGEILRLGSLGSGMGWFSGDGPGPSLRGIMRGAAGALGGLGVFTKVAGHLHPWPGPRRMELKGISPYYEAEIPPNFKYHVIEWPTWEQCSDAQYKIGEAGIAYAIHKTGGPGSHGAIVTGNNNEYWEKRDVLTPIPAVSMAIVMAGNSTGENEYQAKALNRILEDTGGKFLPLGEQPLWRDRDYINMIRGCFIPRLAFRLGGAFGGTGWSAQESVDHTDLLVKLEEKYSARYKENGTLIDDGVNEMWQTPFEGGHLSVSEGGHPYDPNDAEAFQRVTKMMQDATEEMDKIPLAHSWMSISWEVQTKFISPLCGNYHVWMRKIKKNFDPNAVSDPANYISGEEED
jgi:glycolate oxidase